MITLLYKNCYTLSKQVREAQKSYFKTRTNEALTKSKSLEKQLDGLFLEIEAEEAKLNNKQQTLF